MSMQFKFVGKCMHAGMTMLCIVKKHPGTYGTTKLVGAWQDTDGALRQGSRRGFNGGVGELGETRKARWQQL